MLTAAIYLVNLNSLPTDAVHREPSSSSNNLLSNRQGYSPDYSSTFSLARVELPPSFGAEFARAHRPPFQSNAADQHGDSGAHSTDMMDGTEPVVATRRQSTSRDDTTGGAVEDASASATGAAETSENEGGAGGNGDDEADSTSTADSSPHEAAENTHNPFLERHHSQLQAMQDLFERRQLAPHQHQHHQQQVPASQELNPIAIGLDAPFGLPPFDGGGGVGVDGMRAPKVMGGPMDPGPLAFGLNPLPHLLGFPGSGAPFEGPQRGDQSAHSNSHASSLAQGSETDSTSVGGGAAGQKVWPKIFRFTDGRINLSDFEKQKKIRLSNKHNSDSNHIETPPIMFDNRPLKRKSFLILHGGIFAR